MGDFIDWLVTPPDDFYYFVSEAKAYIDENLWYIVVTGIIGFLWGSWRWIWDICKALFKKAKQELGQKYRDSIEKHGTFKERWARGIVQREFREGMLGEGKDLWGKTKAIGGMLFLLTALVYTVISLMPGNEESVVEMSIEEEMNTKLEAERVGKAKPNEANEIKAKKKATPDKGFNVFECGKYGNRMGRCSAVVATIRNHTAGLSEEEAIKMAKDKGQCRRLEKDVKMAERNCQTSDGQLLLRNGLQTGYLQGMSEIY